MHEAGEGESGSLKTPAHCFHRKIFALRP